MKPETAATPRRALNEVMGRPVEHEPSAESVARIIRRAEAARRLSCSLRTVDKLAASGALQKRKLPGRVRASGFLEADIEALITQKTA